MHEVQSAPKLEIDSRSQHSLWSAGSRVSVLASISAILEARQGLISSSSYGAELEHNAACIPQLQTGMILLP